VTALNEFLTVNRYRDKLAFGIVVLLVEVKFGVVHNVSVDRKLSFEYLVVGVVLVLDQYALGCHQVGSGQSFNFPVCQLPLLVGIQMVKPFRTSSGACRQVFEIFELPVSPTYKMIVSIICDLVDLLGAGTLRKASAEFSDEKWYTESVGVCLPLG